MKKHTLGIDIGSTTVKIAILDENDTLVFSDYERHFANIQETLADLLQKAEDQLGELTLCPVITGSGGLTLANHLEVPLYRRLSPYPLPFAEAGTKDGCCYRAWRRGCQDHLFRKRKCRAAYEWYLCRRYRFLH